MSTGLRPSQVSESKPVLILASTVAASAALMGVLAAVPQVPWWIVTTLGAVTAVGTAVGGQLTQRRTVPWEDVAAKVTPTGHVISGPADDKHPTGASVAVVADTPSSSFQPGTTVYPEGEGDAL